MMDLCTVLSVIVFTASCRTYAQDGGPRPLRYLALGDSFTIGTGGPPDLAFPAQLKRFATKRGIDVRLENVAVNGYSTREVIDEELEALTRFKPELVTLAVGANDIVRHDDEGEYRKNLKRIFNAINDVKPKKVLVLPQPDWSQSPVSKGFGDRDAIRARIEKYNAILAEEAKTAGAQYVDLFPEFVEQAKAGLIAPDGLHPNSKAYTAWANALLPLL
ncbi:MAG: SGNH/GDSL hydrolase family protein [Archangium sp.]